MPFAPTLFASGLPIVRKLDDCTGGLHDPELSGAPCVRFGLVHWLYAGTRATRIGDAPFGRTKPASGGVYQAIMIPITSVCGEPVPFWYSLWSLITSPDLIGNPCVG